MRVGIIGTGWGRTHCGTFRAAGCEVVALAGRRQSEVEDVAAAEGVPLATTDVAALTGCDVIVIASPTDTHLGYLRRFADHPVLCEKPLLGAPPAPDALDGLGLAPQFVNYAFPFLDSTRAIDGLLEEGRLGRVRRILLAVGVRFPASKTPAGWFVDVAAHPLSWLLHRFGEFRPACHRVGAGTADVGVILVRDGLQLDAALYWLPETGIRIDLKLVGERASLDLRGGYRPDRAWWFEPLRLDGEACGSAEHSADEDIWFRANRRAVALFCAVLRGEISRQDALGQGGFDLTKALAMERMLTPLLRDDADAA